MAACSGDVFHCLITSSVALYHIRPFLYDADIIALSQSERRTHQRCGSQSYSLPLRRPRRREAGDADRSTFAERLATIQEDLVSDDRHRQYNGITAVQARAQYYRIESSIVRRLLALANIDADDTDSAMACHVASALECVLERADVDDAVNFIHAGGINILMRMLSAESHHVAAAAADALCHLSEWQHHHNVRRTLAAANVLRSVLSIIHQRIDRQSWTLSATHRRHMVLVQRLCERQMDADGISDALTLLTQVIRQQTDTPVLTSACQTIPALKLEQRNPHVLEDIVQTLFPALKRLSHVLPAPPNSRYAHLKLVAEVFSSILTALTQSSESVNSIKVSILCGLGHLLIQVLDDDEDLVVKDIVLGAASQMAYRKHDDVQCLIDAEFIPLLVQALRRTGTSAKPNANKFLCAVAWTLTNATDEQDEQQVQAIVDCGVIEAIIYSLEQATDSHLIEVLLRALQNILECGEDDSAENKSSANVFANMINACSGQKILGQLTKHTINVIASNANDVMSIVLKAPTGN